MKLRISNLLAEQNLRGKHAAMIANSLKIAIVNVPTGSAFFTADSANLTLTTPQDWITGTAVKISFVGVGPQPSISPLNTNSTYWLIRSSATSFKLAYSFSEAIAQVSIAIQPISEGYQIKCEPAYNLGPSQLAKWEPIHPAYSSRIALMTIANLSPIIITGNVATLEVAKIDLTNASGLPLTYNAIVLWAGGTMVPGNADGYPNTTSPLELAVAGNVTPQSVTIAPQTARRITYSITETFDL